MIETLPLLIPDPQRSARTTARCHERLARRRKRLAPVTGKRPTPRSGTVERALIGIFCVVYLSGVALVAIEVLIELN